MILYTQYVRVLNMSAKSLFRQGVALKHIDGLSKSSALSKWNWLDFEKSRV